MAKQSNQAYFDKTGTEFVVDHIVDQTAYVRPMVKILGQTRGYEGEVYEDEFTEPASYLVTMPADDLFNSPPVAVVDAELEAKKAELEELRKDARQVVADLKREQSKAEQELAAAKRDLEKWMKSHRVMIDLGKLLDGEILYPLSVRQNPYHRGREIPQIPDMRDMRFLSIHSGNFESGQKWIKEEYARDTYGSPFRFFDTEDERNAVIKEEFDSACEQFRKAPDFETASWTTGTDLNFGTLLQWVKAHPALCIPDDIQKMKMVNDATLAEEHKAKLRAELEAIEGN